jgi:hypothetical protein
MAKLNLVQARDLLQAFEFGKLFIDELGWENPAAKRAKRWELNGLEVVQKQISQLGGVAVFEVTTGDGVVPDAKLRAAIQREISKAHFENLVIFLDKNRNQSLWYWVKREGKKTYPRPHTFVKGQPGDLFLSHIASMFVDLSELDEHGNLLVTESAERVKKAFDVEVVTKKFFTDYKEAHLRFVQLIEGIDSERDRAWYASVLLNRLMFIYFLQRKFFINNGDDRYLQSKLDAAQPNDEYWYYETFLRTLFFEGFAKPELSRSTEARALLGEIKFLNGGLFLPHQIEEKYGNAIRVPNAAFTNILTLFGRYSWNLNDTPGADDNEIRPDVLGYIFEKYINQKAFGAYYTRPEITEYLCEQTINKLILEKVNRILDDGDPGENLRKFDNIGDLLLHLDAFLCRQLLNEILPSISILDPAVGSGAFLVAALRTLIKTYSAAIGRIEFLNDRNLTQWLKQVQREHPSIAYFIKKRIITDNLFGVDILEEAAEIAKLRLFLALVASAQTVDQLEPLPNIDFNLLTGNSLIGLMHVDGNLFDERNSQQGNLFRNTYAEILAETTRKIATYRKNSIYSENLVGLRDDIDKIKLDTAGTLNEILLAEFQSLGIKFEQAIWDTENSRLGKPTKRQIKLSDLAALKPFHWGFEFDEIINQRGGFDIIITNPPWEIFKPDSKEFFNQYSDLVKKKKMDVGAFEQEQKKLLQDPDILGAWLEYLSSFPYVSSYFRSVLQYENQISTVNGKKSGTDINLYKLFLEQSFNLLQPKGRCGIILQSGLYTDLGSTQLREMLYSQGTIDSLFGLSNEKFVFENVHHAQKFCILVFEKGGHTESFEAAFRINPREAVAPDRIGTFLNSTAEHVKIEVPLLRRLSPSSLSVLEFKNELDVEIAKKLSEQPLLGNQVDNSMCVVFTREFDMTQKSAKGLTHKTRGRNMKPLYEGKMIWQFSNTFAPSTFYVSEPVIRKFMLGRNSDDGQTMDYQTFRLVFRRQASNTNSRTLISTVIPPGIHADNLASIKVIGDHGERLVSGSEQLILSAILNSFVIDYAIRQRVSQNLNFFYLYQLPIPRLDSSHPAFGPIVDRAARLICTTPEFEDLATEAGLRGHVDGVQNLEDRAAIRAQLDGIIAHLYGLNEKEFVHILSTFPLVEQRVKDMTVNAYMSLAPKLPDETVRALIKNGENSRVEFKATARWDVRQAKLNKAMEEMVVKTVAAFLNTDGGELLIGVDDDGNVNGLDDDYKLFGKKNSRDAYENFLTTLFLREFGKDSALLFSISFHELDGKDVAKVAVQRSPRPVFVKEGNQEHLYIRAGNSTRQPSTKEAIDYCKNRWP